MSSDPISMPPRFGLVFKPSYKSVKIAKNKKKKQPAHITSALNRKALKPATKQRGVVQAPGEKTTDTEKRAEQQPGEDLPMESAAACTTSAELAAKMAKLVAEVYGLSKDADQLAGREAEWNKQKEEWEEERRKKEGEWSKKEEEYKAEIAKRDKKEEERSKETEEWSMKEGEYQAEIDKHKAGIDQHKAEIDNLKALLDKKEKEEEEWSKEKEEWSNKEEYYKGEIDKRDKKRQKIAQRLATVRAEAEAAEAEAALSGSESG